MENCQYHPNKKATISCGKCDKYVCTSERLIHPKIKKKGKNKDNHDYCMPCLYDLKIQKLRISKFGGYAGVLAILYLLIAIFVFIFGSIFVQTFRDGEWGMIMISAIIFLGPAAALYYASTRVRKAGNPALDYIRRQDDFLASVEE